MVVLQLVLSVKFPGDFDTISVPSVTLKLMEWALVGFEP